MPDLAGEVELNDELAGIVMRASGLGFDAARVATALGISAPGLAAILQRIAEGAPTHGFAGG